MQKKILILVSAAAIYLNWIYLWSVNILPQNQEQFISNMIHFYSAIFSLFRLSTVNMAPIDDSTIFLVLTIWFITKISWGWAKSFLAGSLLILPLPIYVYLLNNYWFWQIAMTQFDGNPYLSWITNEVVLFADLTVLSLSLYFLLRGRRKSKLLFLLDAPPISSAETVSSKKSRETAAVQKDRIYGLSVLPVVCVSRSRTR